MMLKCESMLTNSNMNSNEANSQILAATPQSRRPSNFWLIIVAALFIIVPFLAWYTTWFGRALSDEDVAKYLADEKNPRHVQHALAQLETRIENGDPGAKKFYPQVLALTNSPTAEIRKTAAWVMGQDNTSEEFHGALLSLLHDSEPLVRRNAALQLVRFGDASGRSDLRAMLVPFEAKSPLTGTIVSLLPVGSKLSAGGLLARIRESSGAVQEFRSPVDGTIAALSAKESDVISSGQTVASIKPYRGTTMDALRALAYVGTSDDLALIEASKQADGAQEVVQQASATETAIKTRAKSAAR